MARVCSCLTVACWVVAALGCCAPPMARGPACRDQPGCGPCKPPRPVCSRLPSQNPSPRGPQASRPHRCLCGEPCSDPLCGNVLLPGNRPRRCLRCRILAVRGALIPFEPYRPFDEHFPRFHPVPTSPVFPSLYVAASAPTLGRGTEVDGPGGSGPQRKPPALPAPLPEVIPTPEPEPDKTAALSHASLPIGAVSRRSAAISWIFLPTAGATEPGSGRVQAESVALTRNPTSLR